MHIYNPDCHKQTVERTQLFVPEQKKKKTQFDIQAPAAMKGLACPVRLHPLLSPFTYHERMTHQRPHATSDLYLSHLCVTVWQTDPHSLWSSHLRRVTWAGSIRAAGDGQMLSPRAQQPTNVGVIVVQRDTGTSKWSWFSFLHSFQMLFWWVAQIMFISHHSVCWKKSFCSSLSFDWLSILYLHIKLKSPSWK